MRETTQERLLEETRIVEVKKTEHITFFIHSCLLNQRRFIDQEKLRLEIDPLMHQKPFNIRRGTNM